MENKKVLIIGGNGFIGANLAQYLSKTEKEVFAFDLIEPIEKKENIQYLSGDFFNEETLFKAVDLCDCIIHSLSTINPGNSNQMYMKGYENDFIQSIKLFEYCCKSNKQLIFLSSGGTVYGNQTKMPIDEDQLPIPINHYGSVKLCIETVLRTFNAQMNANMKIIRISNPYGPGQDYLKGVGFIDAAIKKTIHNEVIEIWGNGNIVRDYIYIDDVCKMINSLLDYTGNVEVFNVSSGQGVSQNEVIYTLKELGYSPKVIYKDMRSVDANKIILDNAKIIEVSKEKPYTFQEGLKKYLDFLERNSID